MMTLPPPAPDAEATPLPHPRRWRIEWHGRTYLETDLTGAHLGVLGLVNGADDWRNLDVSTIDPTAGPVRLMMMIVAFEAVERGAPDATSAAAIVAEVAATRVEDILASLHFE
jgi:hypothetical protein